MKVKRYYTELTDSQGDLAEVVRATDYDNLSVDLGSMTLRYEIRKDESEAGIAELYATNIALKACGAGYEKLKAALCDVLTADYPDWRKARELAGVSSENTSASEPK